MAGWEAARGVAMKAQVASGSWQTQHVLQMHSSGGESPPEAKKIFGQWLRCVLHQILDLASSRSQTSRYIVLHVHQCASMFINVLHIPQHFHDPFSARVGIRSLVVDRSQLPGFQGWWNSLPSNCHCTICMPLWRLYLWPLESEACLTKRGKYGLNRGLGIGETVCFLRKVLRVLAVTQTPTLQVPHTLACQVAMRAANDQDMFGFSTFFSCDLFGKE